MKFHALLDFVQTSMRMARICQPVMIRTLLDHQGEADDEQIAKNLLSRDRSQIEYYQQITRNMVGCVLRGQDVVEKEGKEYRLVGFDKFIPAKN
jgi:ATP adenylyltransferase